MAAPSPRRLSAVESLVSTARHAEAPQLSFSQAATALHCAARMTERHVIDADERGALKDIIVRSDPRVVAACTAYDEGGSLPSLLDALERLAAVARREAAARRTMSISSRGRR
jgi:hypothetical protein